jgi:hypothetical protein
MDKSFSALGHALCAASTVESRQSRSRVAAKGRLPGIACDYTRSAARGHRGGGLWRRSMIIERKRSSGKVRHVRIMAVCILAACGICAFAAANASAALPEWGKCVKLPTTIKGKEKKAGKGKYANSNCTEAGGAGEYEFVKGTEGLPGGTEFTNALSSESAELETASGLGAKCTGEHASGDIAGTKEVTNVVVTFTGCAVNLIPEFSCENTFAETPETEKRGGAGDEEFHYVEGEIKTFGLKGKLVYISGQGTANPEVGLELEPNAKDGWFAIFGCGPKGKNPLPAIKSVVGRKPYGANGGDKIVSPISPVNTMGTETVQTYKSAVHTNPETGEVEDRGVQAPDEINGKPAHLESTLFFESFEQGAWGNSAQVETAVTKLNSGEELEIKA